MGFRTEVLDNNFLYVTIRLVEVTNGTQTVDVTDDEFSQGPIALQYGAGTVRFRNVQIRSLE